MGLEEAVSFTDALLKSDSVEENILVEMGNLGTIEGVLKHFTSIDVGRPYPPSTFELITDYITFAYTNLEAITAEMNNGYNILMQLQSTGQSNNEQH